MSELQKSSFKVFMSALGIFGVIVLTATLASGRKIERLENTVDGLKELKQTVKEYRRENNKQHDELRILLYDIKSRLPKK